MRIRIQSQWLKQYVEFNTHKKIKAEKNGDKDGEELYKLMNMCCIWKNNGKPKKQNRCKTCKQQKRLFKMDIEYGDNSRLLFTDIDSLIYEIKTEDVYEDFSNDKEMFDFSNYSTKPKYYNNSNKLVVGKIKDETAGVAIEEFVELKPKMYSYLVNDNSEYKKAEAVNTYME